MSITNLHQVTKAARFIVVVVLAAALGCQDVTNDRAAAESQSSQPALKPASFYTVDHYNAGRDPMADLIAAMQRAGEESKQIMIQVGGNWCRWCHILSQTFENDPQLNRLLNENFLVMKVSVDQENSNDKFLRHFPAVRAFPHLFIMDADGTILASQDPTSFEGGRGYNKEAILAFFSQWKR